MMEKLVLVQKAISKVFGDFVAKVVSDSVDVLKDAIKDADLDRKSYNRNLQTRLYRLIVDALNRFTYNKYEKQDKLYDAAESIIKGCISSNDNMDAVKSGLKMLVSGVNNDTCQEFLEILCSEICRDDNSDLYKEMDMLWKKQESEYFRGEFAKIDQNDREIFKQLNSMEEVLDFIKRNMNRQEGDRLGHNEVPIVNRADEYTKKWNKNVFLNNFNEEDENVGVNIKLSDIYIEECLPHYIWRTNERSKDTLRNLLAKYIININEKKMLLILGQAGIGKSTLITWIMANLVERKENIQVYQFASDLRSVNWQDDNILDEIFTTIDLGYNMLEGKTLILDGFDEVSVKENRERILYKLYQELEKKNYLRKFSLVLTCRENYVDKVELEGIEYITLQAWDETQIRSFCENYEKIIVGKDLARDNRNLEMKIGKIMEKKDIMGIPLILYMVLALNVDVEKSSSTVDIYDQVFSLKKGGIYDRGYDIEHRINTPEIKRHIHHISQRIAFWMFENNADKATISQEKFEEICKKVIGKSEQKNSDLQGDALIGNFFRVKHCEGKGTNEIQFMHRSIYEYFTVIFFWESIYGLQAIEEVAGKLGELLKDGQLSEHMLEFIKFKFDSIKGYNLSDVTREVFNIMLRDGMTFHIGIPLLNIMNREMNIFENMLEIVLLWNSKLEELNERIITYLQHNNGNGMNLKGIKLKHIDLSEINLKNAYLVEADLEGANLMEANLTESKLTKVRLVKAKLIDARLRDIEVEEGNWEEVKLTEANLICSTFKKTNLENAYMEQACLIEAYLERINLAGAYLAEANLMGIRLNEVDLTGAFLEKVNLTGAYLEEANLAEVSLKKVNLAGAHLEKVSLINACLEEVNLTGAHLNKTVFNAIDVNLLRTKYNLSDIRVFIPETEEIISYKEYCNRQRKF